MNLRHTLTHVALLMAAAWLASAGAAFAADAAPAAPPIGAVDEKTRLFTHTATYPPLALVWEASADAGRAIGVFPHPALPGRVVLATLDGLLASDDAGATWRPLPQAARGRVGPVRGVAFSPERFDTFYLATDGKGVWATDDAGKTFRPLGTKASGLASDRVAGVHVYPGDRTFRTLMAVHGDAAAGISMTTDAGGTWRVVSAGYHVRHLLMGGPGDLDFFAAATRTDAPAVVSLYYAVSLDDYWIELIKDIIPTGMARSVRVGRGSLSTEVLSGSQVFVATADAGLYRVDQGGGQRAG
ncbi:MAG: hypothetical protein IMZ66_01715, partial [Planctomycetes bacterium]|nr:hypothetical protein [Planctomycetota bacterium]